MTLGIYGVSSQSGLAFFADYVGRGYKVIGYARNTVHGMNVLNAIKLAGGVNLIRPKNSNHEDSRFVSLGSNVVTHDLEYMVSNSDIIIIALPSIYQVDAVREMSKTGKLLPRKVPMILSPSRTVATPYVWQITGAHYPVVCFSTCPYSCKMPDLNASIIKRRKRTWVISLEGLFSQTDIRRIKSLFPQAAVTRTPALTSLNNIGAVFHCATYLLNYDAIRQSEQEQRIFSFYMDGIARRPEVGQVLEQIDQVRLQIAYGLGMSVFGLQTHPREDVWRKLTNGLRALEAEHEDDIDILRSIRKKFTEYLNNSVLSAQHWLDITYGVVRKDGESLSEAISRTPTYQTNSVPQKRYLEEDIPTGLVPFEALAKYLNIDCSVISEMIELYNKKIGYDIRTCGRNLQEFDMNDIVSYLKKGVY